MPKYSSSRRRLSSTSTVTDMTADLALVSGNIAGSFVSTLTSTPLTLDTLAQNIVVFVTIGSFLGLMLVMVGARSGSGKGVRAFAGEVD